MPSWVSLYFVTTGTGRKPNINSNEPWSSIRTAAQARKATELARANSPSLASLGYALGRSGKQAESRSLLDGLLKLSTGRHVSAHKVAVIYNGLGERDEALAWLERAFEQRDP